LTVFLTYLLLVVPFRKRALWADYSRRFIVQHGQGRDVDGKVVDGGWMDGRGHC